MKILATIEARMSSTRLPGKVMFKLNNKPMIEFLYNRLKESKLINQIVVATTKSKSDSKLAKYLKKKNIAYFRGSENDVLSRIVETSKKYKADIIVQLTGDNPLVDPEMIDFMISFFLKKKNKIDFLSNSGLGDIKKRQIPYGLDIQIFKFKDLLKISQNKKITDKHKEHPSLYFYREGKKEFNIKNIDLPRKWKIKNLFRLTVDTIQDYKVILKIVNHFKFKKNSFSTNEIYKYLKRNNKILKLNQNIEQKKI